MRMNRKGQVTIPARLRAELDLRAGDEVDVVIRDGQLLITRPGARTPSGRRVVEHMRGKADAGLTTDELMDLKRPADSL